MMEKVDEVCIPYAEFFPLNVRDDLICMPRVWYWLGSSPLPVSNLVQDYIRAVRPPKRCGCVFWLPLSVLVLEFGFFFTFVNIS